MQNSEKVAKSSEKWHFFDGFGSQDGKTPFRTPKTLFFDQKRSFLGQNYDRNRKFYPFKKNLCQLLVIPRDLRYIGHITHRLELK